MPIDSALSRVLVVWPMLAAACLTLAPIQLPVRLAKRAARPSRFLWLPASAPWPCCGRRPRQGRSPSTSPATPCGWRATRCTPLQVLLNLVSNGMEAIEKAHGGTLRAENHAHGARFLFTVPTAGDSPR